MRVRLLVALALTAAVLLAACTGAAPTPHPTQIVPTLAPPPTVNPEGDAANGQKLFTEWRCTACHAEDATGSVGPDLSSTRLTLASFTAAVRQTRPPKPAFSESELSDSDVRDIYTWAKNLEPEAVASVTEDAAGQVVVLAPGEILGMELYTQSGCNTCHGAFAQGSSFAPVLADYQDDAPAFLLAMSSTTADVPEHDLEKVDAALMKRLHTWLQEGANPSGGC